MDYDDVTIVMPTDGTVHPGLERFIHQAVNKGADCIVERQGEKVRFPKNPSREKYTNINITRNKARERALRTKKNPWFLFLDSDVVPPDNAIDAFKLRSKINNCPVMGGWYPVRNGKIQVSRRQPDDRYLIEIKTRWVAGRLVGDRMIHQFYNPRTYKDMHSNIAPLGCLWINSDLSSEMRFMPGCDTVVKDVYIELDRIAGDCTEFGVRLWEKYKIHVRMNQGVVCQHGNEVVKPN